MDYSYLRDFLKYEEDGSVRPYYVGIHGEIHEVRNGVDTAYPTPRGYSQAFNGKFYLMIDGLKCQPVKEIYGCNTSHEDIIIKREKTMHDDGSRTNYTEMLVLAIGKEPMVKCTTQVLDKDLHRVDELCKVEYFEF